jgi:hypothetical protein
MWDAKREQLEHEIEIWEDLLIKGFKDAGCSISEATTQLSRLKQELKDLAVRTHHQA